MFCSFALAYDVNLNFRLKDYVYRIVIIMHKKVNETIHA